MRVLVLTAPVGDGHLSAARTLAEDITTLRPDASVVIVDALAELPRPLSWLFRDAYRWQLRAAPWLFAVLFGALRRSRVMRAASRWLVSLTCSRSILRAARGADADVVVSTWPVTTTILGCLRLRGKLRSPVCATITDFAGLELWADRGVDLHVVMHPALVEPVERLAGSGSVEAVAPLVGAEFLVPCDRRAARRALGLPNDGRVVLVSGGGWGVGDLESAVRGALELPGTFVICLAGRDEGTRLRLETAFDGDPRVSVLGFTDRMSELLAAADVLVHSTGGVTCLEAMARGCRIVAYRPPPGHSPLLAREMSRLGLLVHARSPVELRTALSGGVQPPSPVAAVAAARRVLELRPRVARRLRSRLARPLAASAATTLVLSALSTSALAYHPVAEIFRLPDETVVGARSDEIGLVIEGRRQDLLALADVARARGLRASVVAATPLTANDVRRLRRVGLEPIPALTSHGLRSWLRTKHQLGQQKSDLGLGRPFVYLAPAGGLTVSEYLIARHLGGRPVPVDATIPASGRADPTPGTVAAIELGPGRAGRRALLREIARIEGSGETPVSVTRLLAERGAA
jgi:processive 1,2-diacylglycerol beta-glucosyltransferase